MKNRVVGKLEEEKILKNSEYLIDPELPVNLLRRDPQPEFQLHSHEFSELVIVYAGTGIHYTNNGESLLKTGDVFVINGGNAHGFKETKDLKLVNVVFNLKNLESPLSDLPMLPSFHILFTIEPEFRSDANYHGRLNLDKAQLGKAMGIVDEMEREISSKQAGRCIMVSALFMQLAAFLIRAYEKAPPNSSSNLTKLGKVFSYIRKNFRKKLKVSELADIASMSESTLTRAFIKSVGMPPIAYCCQHRIHYSMGLLANSEMSISEIAMACGFEDSNYFTRIFSQQTGCSPREYRKLRDYL